VKYNNIVGFKVVGIVDYNYFQVVKVFFTISNCVTMIWL
jgi:hypothetical protein